MGPHPEPARKGDPTLNTKSLIQDLTLHPSIFLMSAIADKFARQGVCGPLMGCPNPDSRCVFRTIIGFWEAEQVKMRDCIERQIEAGLFRCRLQCVICS